MPYQIKPCQKIRGSVSFPGDKSIAHRAVIISAIAMGSTLIKNFSFSDDCQATIKALRSLGVVVKEINARTLSVKGVGLFGLQAPRKTINVAESGTTMRLLAGLLCAQGFASILDGKKGLRKRPMHRVLEPLRVMGARISARKNGKDEYPPLRISPGRLKALRWTMSVPSAQVKSAILLAGMYAEGISTVLESIPTRDHTERMLRHFKARISVKGKSIRIAASTVTSPKELVIPGDISSASFFIVLACVLKDSRITIRDVCLNPTRCGIIEVLKKMGARIKVANRNPESFEPVGDLIVESSSLHGVVVKDHQIPSLIDELPILMVAACFAQGKTVLEGVGELRVKETDRINSMIQNLSKMGVCIETKHKGNKEVIIIEGWSGLSGANLKSFGDHRTAMSMVVAALGANSPSSIDNMRCVSKSLPGFFDILAQIVQ